MVARALLTEMTFGTAASRERPLGIHIPYARHVDDRTIRTRTGLLLTTLKLEGYCFETADMSEINARMMARNEPSRHATAAASATQPTSAPCVTSTESTPHAIVCVTIEENHPTGWQTRYVRPQRS